MRLLTWTACACAPPGPAQSSLDKWWAWGVDKFAEELAGGINRCNYNQPTSSMNALASEWGPRVIDLGLGCRVERVAVDGTPGVCAPCIPGKSAGLVSFLPAAEGRVWAVREGNSQLAVRMLNASGATLALNTHVASLERAKDGTYTLTTTPVGGAPGDAPPQQAHGPYTGVVIAAPLELADLSLKLATPAAEDGADDGAAGQAQHQCAACPCSSKKGSSCSSAQGVGGTCALAARQYATTVTTYVVGQCAAHTGGRAGCVWGVHAPVDRGA